MQRQRLASAERDKERAFEMVEQFLPGETPLCTYREAAEKLNMPVGTFKSEVHRNKARFRVRLREAVLETVEDESQMEDEIRYLISVLGKPD